MKPLLAALALLTMSGCALPEKAYWRYMEGPLLTCEVCGQTYRRDSIRGMCEHAYRAWQERQR